jgi:hypothetical protein
LQWPPVRRTYAKPSSESQRKNLTLLSSLVAENSDFALLGQKRLQALQKSDLRVGTGVAFASFEDAPEQWKRAFTVGEADGQNAMARAHSGRVQDQANRLPRLLEARASRLRATGRRSCSRSGPTRSFFEEAAQPVLVRLTSRPTSGHVAKPKGAQENGFRSIRGCAT